MANILWLDLETISEADLRKMGAHAYAGHPSTKVICCAYAFNDGPVQMWLPGTEALPAKLKEHIDNRHPFVAWNVQFEAAIWAECLPHTTTHPPHWQCAMANAAYFGLPLGMDQAADALGLPLGKDKIGHALMRRMCRPRSRDAAGEPVWWHETNPEKFLRLQSYCRMDVVLMRTIAWKSNKALPPAEVEVWKADWEMNQRGVRLDQDLVDKLIYITDQEKGRLDGRMALLTGGEVPNCQRVQALRDWLLNWEGVTTTSLDKEHLAALLKEALPAKAQEALEIRQEAAKSSTAKLQTMSRYANKDGRMRGLIQYYGASRTGRFAGRGAQPHNYPRPSIKDPENAIAYIKEGMTVEGVRSFWGSPMAAVSSCLRGCFIPSPGYKFISVDFSQIEARVLAWLCGQDDVLQVFADGGDVYTYAAKNIGSDDRQLGKVLVLACGFGMGGGKFQETAGTYGIKLSVSEATSAVDGWRKSNREIVKGWRMLDNICQTVVRDGRSAFRRDFQQKIRVQHEGDALTLLLPSGRKLYYREPRMIEGRFGSPQIGYMGINSYTRKWELIETYGGKLIENVVQAIARDLLTDAMVRLGAMQHRLVLTVHDELLLEVVDNANLPTRTDLIVQEANTVPPWAKGLPMACNYWIGDRYKK